MSNVCKPIVAAILATVMYSAVLAADDLDRFIDLEMRKRQIPGLTVVVLRDGKVVRAKGYGLANLETNTPATPETVYEIGSISKQFAAQALMLLVREGRVGLGDSIVRHLPNNSPASWTAITVRDLISHTSGIKDWTELSAFDYGHEYSAEEFVDLIGKQPLGFKPRENWSYSNSNLPLIGMIVEKTSGRPYEEFVASRIFDRLGFKTIRFNHQEDVVTNRASGYVLRNARLRNGERRRPTIIAPSGGVLSSTLDLARWWDATLTGRILKKEELSEMLEPTLLVDGRSVAHGFAFFTNTFNGHKFIFHHGSTAGGFGSGVYYFPEERVTVAVAGNLEDGGFGSEYIAKRVFNKYVPGSFIGGLRPKTGDRNDEMRRVLEAVAKGENSDLLTESYRKRITPQLRERVGSALRNVKRLEYLGSERLGRDHFVLDPTLVEVHYFRITTAKGTLFVHFRVDQSGRTGFIIVED